jgi:medium-chain acyl-[acyl-carrier-protein] hydrolase
MTSTPEAWSESVLVRAFEVGPDGEAGVPALCNWLQDAAGNHASALDWGMDTLQAKSLTWVLARLHVQLDRLPVWREALTVRTWPTGVQRVLAVRDFRVEGGGAPVAVATSGWVLVDTTTRRPVRPGPALHEIATHMPPRALFDPFDRLPELPATPAKLNVRVGRSDLDLNGHANNVRFIAWALDALPAGAVAGLLPTDIEIELRAEAREGEVLALEVAATNEPDTWLHRIVRVGDARELARARSRWRPRVRRADETRQIQIVRDQR